MAEHHAQKIITVAFWLRSSALTWLKYAHILTERCSSAPFSWRIEMTCSSQFNTTASVAQVHILVGWIVPKYRGLSCSSPQTGSPLAQGENPAVAASLKAADLTCSCWIKQLQGNIHVKCGSMRVVLSYSALLQGFLRVCRNCRHLETLSLGQNSSWGRVQDWYFG